MTITSADWILLWVFLVACVATGWWLLTAPRDYSIDVDNGWGAVVLFILIISTLVLGVAGVLGVIPALVR